MVNVPDDQLTLKERMEQNGGTPVTTAFGAQQLGATPDQSKMAGTQAQKQPVVEEQIAKEETLAGAERLDVAGREVAQVAQSQYLANLQTTAGSLGAAVKDRTQEILSKQAIGEEYQQWDTPKLQEFQDDLSTLGFVVSSEQSEAIYGDLTSYLDKVLADGVDADTTEELAALENKLAEAGVPKTAVDKYVTKINQSTGKALWQEIKDETVTLGNLFDEQDAQLVNDLKTSLALDDEAFQSMTLTELQSTIQNQIQENFAQVDVLRAKLTSVPVGSNRYRAIVKQLERLGASGVMSQEEAAQRLGAEIDAADEVMIGDTPYTLEEILTDEWVSAQVANYIGGTDKQREEFAKTMPGLAEWVDEHQESFKVISGEFATEQSEFDKVQTASASAATKWDRWDKDMLARSVGLDSWPEGAISQATLDQLQRLDNSLFSQFLGSWEDVKDKSWIKDYVTDEAMFNSLKTTLPSNLSVDGKITFRDMVSAVEQEVANYKTTVDPTLKAMAGTNTDPEDITTLSDYKENLGEDNTDWMTPEFGQYLLDNPETRDYTMGMINSGELTQTEWSKNQAISKLDSTTDPDKIAAALVPGSTIDSLARDIDRIIQAADLGSDIAAPVAEVLRTLGEPLAESLQKLSPDKLDMIMNMSSTLTNIGTFNDDGMDSTVADVIKTTNADGKIQSTAALATLPVTETVNILNMDSGKFTDKALENVNNVIQDNFVNWYNQRGGTMFAARSTFFDEWAINNFGSDQLKERLKTEGSNPFFWDTLLSELPEGSALKNKLADMRPDVDNLSLTPVGITPDSPLAGWDLSGLSEFKIDITEGNIANEVLSWDTTWDLRAGSDDMEAMALDLGLDMSDLMPNLGYYSL
jgi:hypothetical protein